MPETPSTEISEIFPVPLSDIDVSDENVRISGKTTSLDELAASIEIHGLLQPVVLVGEHGSPPYQLISGQRRLLAHERLGRAEIKAVFAGNLSKTEATIRSLVENMQRVDLSFADTQLAVTNLYRELGSEQAVKDRTGLSIRRIRDHLMIEERASDPIKEKIQAGEVSVMDVKRALRAAQDDLEKAEELVDLIIANKPATNVKRRLEVYGKDESRTANEIFEEASKPHVEPTMMLTLDGDLRSSIQEAAEKLELEPPDLACRALEEWLEENGFLGGQE